MKCLRFKLTAFLILSIVLGGRAGWAQDCFTPPEWEQDQLRGSDYDQDGNGVEDGIDQLDPEQAINVLVDLNSCPSAADLARLETFGTLEYVGAYLSVVQISNLKVSDAVALGADPQVALVEMEKDAGIDLNTSVPAIKVKASSVYSPRTAQDKRPGLTGAGVNIAVLDTGVDDGLHESLPFAFAGYDAFVNAEINPDDNHGHGTHVAGTALGRGRISFPGSMRGVAPGAGLVDIKVCNSSGSCPMFVLIRGIERCMLRRFDWNIRIMNLSLGIGIRSNGLDALSQLLNRAALRFGIIPVVSAGNSGRNVIGPMAAADQAITVGATDDRGTIFRGDDVVASFSSRGPRLSDGDGNSNDELKPEIVAPGRLIIAPAHNSFNGYASKSGTSMSAPHVSGLAALILQGLPTLGPIGMKQRLVNNAERLFGPGWTPGGGWGLIDGYRSVP